ncbi:hypothetical protein EMCG_04909 [[Emmonsia] crescens]|uniref:Uncharacterized protein n=1 Tax=[Emmonsia] crescens TaxID=73230 RepID=A0A0G2J6U7_9EURO|nr:hypothetical protein EMCG_04909 [Emmonsia crescens UAMH 3008]
MRSCVLHRFYGLILLLETLGPVRGDRQKAEIISDELGVHNTKLRRHFCNALAYICAFDTGSDNVTAVALDAQPCCTTVLIAANRGVSPEVVEFLQDILSILHDIAQSSPGTDTSLIQEDIIHKVVRLSQPRVRRYHEVAVDMYKSCLPIIQSARIRYAKALANPKAAELARLEEFLTQYFNPSRSIESDHECLDLVKQCHSIRASGMIDSLTLFAAHGQPCQAKFLRLQELLKKLGKHITCSKRLVNAATQLSEEFVCDFKVEPIQPSKLEPICLPLKKASVDSIVARMTSGISEGDKVKEQLKERHPRGLADISQEIEEKLRVAKTQTHAELILISYIEQHGCDFRDPDDRYIGCSKPACYLCHLYIHYHPGKYSVPDTSNKLYVKWRMPDIRSSDQETRVKLNGEAEKILDKMIQEIKTSFKNDLTRPKPRSMHADSSADMTSTIMGGPGLGAGPGPGLQPSDIARHLESLSLATPAYYQG